MYGDDVNRSREYREQIAHLQDYSFDEIVEAIPSDTLDQINLHQIDTIEATGELVPALPLVCEGLTAENRLRILGNTTYYDDDIEDFLDTDPVLQVLYQQIKDSRSSEEISQGIRARRTVVIRMLLEAFLVFDQDTPQENRKKPAA